MIKFDEPPLDPNAPKKRKEKERLRPSETKKFRTRYTSRECEISGIHNARGRRKQFHVHHILPVSHGGRKCLTNLAYVKPDIHERIHQQAREHAKHTRRDLGEVTEELTRDAIQLGKLGRVWAGEDPEKVYKRELHIERRREIQEEMRVRQLELDLGELEP
jgi:hypothetical protein